MKNQSQIFDSGRFFLYLRREFMLNGRQWLFRGLMMLALTTLLLCFCTWPSSYMLANYPDYNYNATQQSGVTSTLIICLTVFVVLGGFLFMENMNTSGKRLNSLMLPASTFEKYASRVLICVIGVYIAFITSFAIADAIRLCILRLTFGNIEGLSYIGPFGLKYIPKQLTHNGLLTLAVQATAVLGSTVWPKNPAPKTIGSVFVLLCLWTMLLTFIFSNTMRGKVMSESGSNAIEYTISALTVIWTLFCYVTAYFRMKESEIIHRL